LTPVRRAVLLCTWALCLLQILTIAPIAAFTFLEPFSPEFWLLLAAFFLTSGWLLGVGGRFLVAAHLAVVVVLLVTHPLTSLLGRDGSVAAVGAHFLLVFGWRTGARPEIKLSLAAGFLGLLLAETLLSAVGRFEGRAPAGLADYGDIMGEYGSAGFLKPSLNLRVVGEKGAATVVTDQNGFRTTRQLTRDKAAGTLRVYFVGDSFVTGYRMDQPDTVGQRLEDELRRRTGRNVEVLVAGAGYPGAAAELTHRHAFEFHPDALIAGVTLGNDLSQCWIARRGLSGHLLDHASLPPEAFKSSYVRLLPVKLHRSLMAWRCYRRLFLALRPEGLRPWYEDSPRRVHLFDPGHSLGHFFSARPLPLVEQSFGDTLAYLGEMARDCRTNGVRFMVAIFPQRFQVRESEWAAVAFDLGLERRAFDLEQPDRRILEWCAREGVECVDLLPGFRAGSGDLYLPLGDMHWNAAGHALAAWLLAERLAA
jgi:hypothetical protein